ncbi:MAG: element excision factor XisI family protein [Thermosynechococcaceae cyanobacterium]
MQLGVPKQDIVLTFHEPAVRQFTGFGTGRTDVFMGEAVKV